MQSGIVIAAEMKSPGGDPEFCSEQLSQLYPRVLKLAHHLVRNHADAEEVVQEVFLKAFQHHCDYRHEAPFSTWLLRITWNEGMRFHRKRCMEVAGLDEVSTINRRPHLWAAVTETPEQICVGKEIEKALYRSLRRVSPLYREVWLLREIAELSDAEIARHLGLCVSTVKVRMHRARKQLRRFVGRSLSRSRCQAAPGTVPVSPPPV